ncbi:MAG: SDR family NAD(P)-dependent oxidoreductase [Verrucomicrobiota bacterium]
MDKPLSGKRALVTGAGSGIGRATAHALADAGAAVLLIGRTPDELMKVFEEIGGTDGGHHHAIADVSDAREMAGAYQQMAGFWDSLDVVVANAGINGVWAPLDKLEVDDWDQTLAINLRGTFLTVKLALPLLRRNGGSVVVVSSVNGNRMFSNSGATAYACSKAAQVAFTKMTALELAKDRIRVNAVCPGAIESQIEDSMETRDIGQLHLPVEFPEGHVPLTHGPAAKADAVADVIVFLASSRSAHVSGTEIYVDGAQSLLEG